MPESECDPTRPRRAGRYLANREFLLGYETELSRERTRALRAEGMERVAIVGLTEEAHRLAELCREAGIEVTGFVTPQRYKLHKVELPFRPLRDFEAFFDTSLDAILLADAQGETTWLELLQTLHLPDRVPLIRTLDTASAKAALFKEHDGERFLNRAFRFSPATVARRPAGAAV